MATMDEIKKLDPDDTFWLGFHSVHTDDYGFFALLLNLFLETIGSKKRARIVIHEDAIRATGVWTQEEAAKVANRMIIGPNGNFSDPKLRRGLFRPLQYLGLIE